MKQDLRLCVDSQFASPYAMSAFVALHEKNLAFEIKTVDLSANAHQATPFAVTSLTQRVPVLVHNGFSLSESSAICEYVNEVFGNVCDAAVAAAHQSTLGQSSTLSVVSDPMLGWAHKLSACCR